MAYLFNVLLVVLMGSPPAGEPFERYGAQYGVDPVILEGICRYESDNGRVLTHKNKNGSWDVGFCMNHRKKSAKAPKVPTWLASVREAAKELAYWKRQHNKFCVKMYKRTGECGAHKWGKWRGIKNCHRPHPWWGHYNWGFRTSTNNYDRKIKCFINNGFKKCTRERWQKIRF